MQIDRQNEWDTRIGNHRGIGGNHDRKVRMCVDAMSRHGCLRQ